MTTRTIKGISSHWRIATPPPYEVMTLAHTLNLSPAVASILYTRGYTSKERALGFLFPQYDTVRYDPHTLKNSGEAVARITSAIERKEKILIFGDYDVDGITSTALLFFTLKDLGAQVNFYLPHRVHDGYGLSKKIIEKAHHAHYNLVITVDNGTTAFEAMECAAELGLSLIITDHHKPKEGHKSDLCLVNPHQEACPYQFKELCGVGVIFKIVSLLYQAAKKHIPEKIYELLTMGTIADLVPLVDENRYWLHSFFTKKDKKLSTCLRYLKANARLEKEVLTATDFAFSLVPQLNALGRLDDPREAVLFLLTEDESYLKRIGEKLYTLNESRKMLEKKYTQEIIKALQQKGKHTGGIAYVHPTIPPGIIGLVAAKVVDFFGIPACILCNDGHGTIKGSCRSIPECNIFECLSAIPPSILLSFGGHAGAGGVSLKEEHFPLFEDEFKKATTAACAGKDIQKKIVIESILPLSDLTGRFWQDLSLLEPFGAQNAIPLFCIEEAKIKRVSLIKDQHVRCTIQSNEREICGIFFNQPFLYPLLQEGEQRFHVAARITQNVWRDKKTLQLECVDIAKA